MVFILPCYSGTHVVKQFQLNSIPEKMCLVWVECNMNQESHLECQLCGMSNYNMWWLGKKCENPGSKNKASTSVGPAWTTCGSLACHYYVSVGVFVQDFAMAVFLHSVPTEFIFTHSVLYYSARPIHNPAALIDGSTSDIFARLAGLNVVVTMAGSCTSPQSDKILAVISDIPP